jgi:hypothetical protein
LITAFQIGLTRLRDLRFRFRFWFQLRFFRYVRYLAGFLGRTDVGAGWLAAQGFSPLKGQMKGFWSVTVRANWRVIFRFAEGQAEDVDLVDYH